MQLTLDLFPVSKEMFDFTWYIEGGENNDYTEKGYTVYMRRDKDSKTGKISTCAIVSGMNFCGQRGNTTFRFLSKKSEKGCQFHNDVILPEIDIMSVDDIKSFTKHVIETNKKCLYEWDYDKRCSIFKRVTEGTVSTHGLQSFYWDLYNEAIGHEKRMEFIKQKYAA